MPPEIAHVLNIFVAVGIGLVATLALLGLILARESSPLEDDEEGWPPAAPTSEAKPAVAAPADNS